MKVNSTKTIIHIHSDPKFIIDISMYENELFDNHFIYVGMEELNLEIFNYRSLSFLPEKDNIAKIIEYLKDADLVVINYLDEFKTQIVNKIPKGVKIAWRFFGIELYSRKSELFLSKATLEIDKHPSRFTIKNFLSNVKNEFYNKLDIDFFKAVKRIDYLLLFSEEEYKLLKKYWDVPKFVKLSLGYELFTPSLKSFNKEPIIILGNNRHNFNNHIDLLNIVNQSQNSEIKYYMFFSYGGNKSYNDKIAERVYLNKQIKLIDCFMGFEEFEDIYNKSSAFVHNGFRQMALGNIFSAIKNGLKIYLNEENVINDWLIRQGFIIASINDLKKDINTNNFTLSTAEIEHNMLQFKKIMDNYTFKDFQNNIICILNEKDN